MNFVGLDWCSRDDHRLQGERGELNDLPGGTLPFFDAALDELPDGVDGDVMLFSHHPMHVPSFNLDQIDRIAQTTSPVSSRISGAWAGHYHVDYEETVWTGGYDVFVTDATWDDANTLRVVQVFGDGERFEVRQRLITVSPWTE
ncbi:MAG: hypothetical protein ACI9MC_002802 [Kiritimatiellia bacterium]